MAERCSTLQPDLDNPSLPHPLWGFWARPDPVEPRLAKPVHGRTRRVGPGGVALSQTCIDHPVSAQVFVWYYSGDCSAPDGPTTPSSQAKSAKKMVFRLDESLHTEWDSYGNRAKLGSFLQDHVLEEILRQDPALPDEANEVHSTPLDAPTGSYSECLLSDNEITALMLQCYHGDPAVLECTATLTSFWDRVSRFLKLDAIHPRHVMDTVLRARAYWVLISARACDPMLCPFAS